MCCGCGNTLHCVCRANTNQHCLPPALPRPALPCHAHSRGSAWHRARVQTRVNLRARRESLPRGLPLGLPRGGVYLPEEYLEEADRPYLVACPAPPEKVLV